MLVEECQFWIFRFTSLSRKQTCFGGKISVQTYIDRRLIGGPTDMFWPNRILCYSSVTNNYHRLICTIHLSGIRDCYIRFNTFQLWLDSLSTLLPRSLPKTARLQIFRSWGVVLQEEHGAFDNETPILEVKGRAILLDLCNICFASTSEDKVKIRTKP